MQYFGLLSLGIALLGVGFSCYYSMTKKALREHEMEAQLSPRARRVQEAAVIRRLLRYHRGLARI